jgi:hypothetical protein
MNLKKKIPVSVETGLALDEVTRLAGTSRLFMDEEESWLRALMSVALPRPLDGLRELRASAPNRSPNRLIISLPTDGDDWLDVSSTTMDPGNTVRRRTTAAADDDDDRRHWWRPRSGPATTSCRYCDGPAGESSTHGAAGTRRYGRTRRRTKGEVTAGQIQKLRQLIHSGLKRKNKKRKCQISYHRWQESGNGRKCRRQSSHSL